MNSEEEFFKESDRMGSEGLDRIHSQHRGLNFWPVDLVSATPYVLGRVPAMRRTELSPWVRFPDLWAGTGCASNQG